MTTTNRATTSEAPAGIITHPFNVIDPSNNQMSSTQPTNAIMTGFGDSNDGGALSRSDTMTDTFTFGSVRGDDDNDDLFSYLNRNNFHGDELDDELDEEIVQRNLNYCRRGEYVHEFKVTSRDALLAPHKPLNRMVKAKLVQATSSMHEDAKTRSFGCQLERPVLHQKPKRLLMREEHFEETTKTCSEKYV